MAPQKETLMVLKVDLDCHRCYTKVKRLLCCYPQIMDQIYNEKQNTVTIKVVCCSPDKIMDKLLSRGGKSIKAIQILQPKKPDANPPPSDKPTQKPPKEAAPKPPADDKPPEKFTNKGSMDGAGPAKAQGGAPPAPQPQGGGPAPAKPKDAAAPAKPADQAAAMMHMMPPELIRYYPVNAGCTACYDGRMCYHGNGYRGYGTPPPAGGWEYYGGTPPLPPPGASGYSYETANRYDDYVSDEDATGCVVM